MLQYKDCRTAVYLSDCLFQMSQWPDSCVDSIVTDPPYELGFMGKGWDASGIANSVKMWSECLRVLRPGGHLLAFGGTRTYHRMACAVEDAGFEIRDSVMWLYGQGFPKSLNVSKAIDRAAGAEREKVRVDASEVRNPKATGSGRDGMEGGTRPWIEEAMRVGYHEKDGEVAVTKEAQQWEGWGTALKPAHEPVVVARKPFKGPVVKNVLEHGTGALNIDGCRIEGAPPKVTGRGWDGSPGFRGEVAEEQVTREWDQPTGRWPANVVLSHLPECVGDCAEGCAVAGLDEQSGQLTSGANPARRGMQRGNGKVGAFGHLGQEDANPLRGAESGGASRFYYCAKASTKERPKVDGVAHPTVKPLALMRWLVRLVTPPGGVCMDPFAGSGTTLEACIQEGFKGVGIDADSKHIPLIMARVERNRDVAV